MFMRIRSGVLVLVAIFGVTACQSRRTVDLPRGPIDHVALPVGYRVTELKYSPYVKVVAQNARDEGFTIGSTEKPNTFDHNALFSPHDGATVEEVVLSGVRWKITLQKPGGYWAQSHRKGYDVLVIGNTGSTVAREVCVDVLKGIHWR